MTEQQLSLFDDLGYYEGVDVEYKGARGGLPRDLWETYSAFANTDGGTLWLGITQRNGKLDVHGVTEAEKLVADFWNTINNRGKVSRNLLTTSSVGIVAVDDKPGHAVIRIDVPRAGRRERPVFIGSDPFHGSFRRNYEGDYRCRDDEVRRMFADQAEEPPDARILKGFSLDDLDTDSIRQFRNRFASRDPNHPWHREDDSGLLVKLQAWRRDRASGIEGLTAAGLLMFGKLEAIRAPEAIPGFHLDYRERLADDPAVRWTDRLTLDGTWEGNLLQFYQRVILKLGSGPGIKAPFQTDAEGYRLSGGPVHEALQEALVNALIHADYSGQGGIVIDRYPNRFEFSNPGTLLVSREQILHGGVSECRNKSLQLMFQMLGVGDKAGSGIDKIRQSWAAEHWQSPSFKETMRPDRVLLTLPMVSMLPEGTVEELRVRFGDAFEQLDRHEVQVVVAAALEGEVSNQRLQEILPLHRVDITKLLQGLVRKNLLVPEGFGRWTRYALPGQIEPEANGGRSEANGESLLSNGECSPANGESLLANGESWTVDGELVERVRSSQRAPTELVEQAILSLCSESFRTLSELTQALNRSPKRLRNAYLPALVARGALELRFPGQATHPDQAYRTVIQGISDT
ncbi:ATP-binding protein [Sulfuritalea sp.]|uniref:ATP-binding protein n=1 Tax=Sulfuritalea sp. TaxID=2480090 RepID=UPI001AC7270E|nr:ATP-binding protein [Sulfuritalea sp.]MBN8474497.1 putative DNA binding domain-containing protein [Sulfuritalea sp.]